MSQTNSIDSPKPQEPLTNSEDGGTTEAVSEVDGTQTDTSRPSSQPSSPNRSETAVSRPKTDQPGVQNVQNLKREILRQKLTIERYECEIQQKCERGFPSPCYHKLKIELCCAKRKLEKMIEQLKREGGNENDLRPTRTTSATSKLSFEDLEIKESLLDDNDYLENDRCMLQNELLNKDQTLQDMEEKLEWMQKQVLRLACENKFMSEKLVKPKSSCCDDKSMSQVKSINASSRQLESSIKSLESNLLCLREELDGLKKERKIKFDLKDEQESKTSTGEKLEELSQPKSPCGDNDNQIATKLKLLQCQYTNLQSEYCHKQKECNETVERMKKCLVSCKGDKERAENEALKIRADKMIAEIGEYKIFIKELQEQVDMYRKKFMTAQEKVEFQKYLLENLEMNNKDVEAQINTEIARIKSKFQEKLRELCPYPSMYEESKLSLEESKAKISELESDLKATMAALCKSKCELNALKQQPDDSLETKYKKLQCEVEMLKTKQAGLKTTKECLEQKLTCMKDELESLRKDSTKIISTTKCCAEKNRQVLHQHINQLEVDLAQCRASAALSLSEKEETIKKMKEELAVLCGNFSDCKGQIKQLKNQVTFLTNQRHKIRPGDLQKTDFCNPDC